MGYKVGYNQNKKALEFAFQSLFLMVEARGIEPLSENRFTETSPSAVYPLRFPHQAADKQAACLGIPLCSKGARSFPLEWAANRLPIRSRGAPR